MDIAVIANPMASQFTGGAHREVLGVLSRIGHVEAIWPASARAVGEAAGEAVAAGARLVVAMGGDGMVHHVAEALYETDSTLGIIPVGTTNVVARLLGIPARPVKAARLIAGKGRVQTVGAVRLDLTRGSVSTTHHAVFAAGFGLDATIVARADRDPYRKYRFGSIHYATTAFGVALGSFPGTPAHLRVASGGRSADAAAVLLQFRSIYTYFGSKRLKLSNSAPSPITALLVERLRRRRIPRIAFNLFTSRDLASIEGIRVWNDVSSLEVVSDPPVAAQADGEGLGLVDGARVTWEPEILRVVSA